MPQPQTTDIAHRIHDALMQAGPPPLFHERLLAAVANPTQPSSARRTWLVVGTSVTIGAVAASSVALAAALHHNSSVVLDRPPTIVALPPSGGAPITPGLAFQVPAPVEQSRSVDLSTAAQLADFRVLRATRADATVKSVEYVTFTVPNAPPGWSISVLPQVRVAYTTSRGSLEIIEHSDPRTGTVHAPGEPGNVVATHNGEQYIVSSDPAGRFVSVSFTRDGGYYALTFSPALDQAEAWGLLDSLG